MPHNLATAFVSPEIKSRLARVVVVRFVIACELTALDWFSFRLTLRPDISLDISSSGKAVLSVLAVGMLLTLAHLWVVTLQTFRSALRAHSLQQKP
jgi:hypothetical protein